MSTSAELEIVSPAEQKLVKFADQTGLEKASTAPLVEAFRPLFIEVRQVLSAADGVAASVKDATCVTEIAQARACRLAIRKVRIAAEKVKKDQKANALAYGRAVDGFYNILLADIEPVETALQDAEDTAERAETARKDAVESGRKTALAPFVADVSLYAVRDMPEATFSALLTGVRVAKEQAEAAAAKAEADRIAKEKAEAAERERIRAENEKLRQEAIAREAAAKAEREAAEKKLADERAEAARIAAEIKAKADREAKEALAKAEQEKAAIEAKRKAEQDAAFAAAEQTRKKVAAEKAEAEAAAKKERDRLAAIADAERKERERLESEAKAARDREAARVAKEKADSERAAAAPDKEKLLAFANDVIGLDAPKMATKKGELLASEIDGRIGELAHWIRGLANTL